MKTVKQITLSGHLAMFRLNEDAYAVLEQYLERAGARLKADPDREEVLRDLEQSIGEKLAARRVANDQVLTLADMNTVLAAVGPVEIGNGEANTTQALPLGKRKLVRITDGQNIAGVCNGLAAYSDIRVDWVRTIFVLGTLATGGLFGLVYLALAFLLPTVPTRAAYVALHNAPGGVPQSV